jgi:hypothetical protein
MFQFSCGTVSTLQWASAGFAFLAAVLWLASAMVKLPPPQITWNSIDDIVPALQRQSRWSAAAAVCAAVSAVVQGVLVSDPTCISLG